MSCDTIWQFQCLCLDVNDNATVVFWGGSEDEEICSGILNESWLIIEGFEGTKLPIVT